MTTLHPLRTKSRKLSWKNNLPHSIDYDDRFFQSNAIEETDEVFRCTVNDFKPGVCKSYPFEMKNGKLSQMSDIMCPTDWDLTGFKEMMIPHLQKDESEWKF